MRLIDADALNAALLDFRDIMCDTEPDDVFEECTYNVVMDCIRTMTATPTIDPESLRPNGRWEIYTDEDEVFGDIYYPKCTLCGKLAFSTTSYCPNCGAKMEENNGEE